MTASMCVFLHFFPDWLFAKISLQNSPNLTVLLEDGKTTTYTCIRTCSYMYMYTCVHIVMEFKFINFRHPQTSRNHEYFFIIFSQMLMVFLLHR